MSDIVSITKEVIDLFAKHDLSRAQSMFVAEAVKMQITEDMVKDMITSAKGPQPTAGVM